jgi:uncharacterized membrane protein
VIDLDFGIVGWVHLLACVIAMAAFVPAMLARKGSRRHRTSGKVYALAYAVLSVSALGIYSLQRFWFPHWLALAGLAVLAVGYLAVRAKPKGWRYLHLVAMLLSAYNLCGGAVNEMFLRVAPLRAIAGSNILAAPVVGMTHGLVVLTFVVLIVFYLLASLMASRSARVPSAGPAR